nr:hypothetical protein [Tanacetum cinerariifolium]
METKDTLSSCSNSEEQQMQQIQDKAKESCMMFIKSGIYLDDEYVVMTRNYFLQYTQLEIPEFHDTLIQHMEYVKKSINERALHKREYDTRVNERQMQITEEKVDTSKALNQSVVRQPTGFKSERPKLLKPRFASQVDVNNDLSKPVTTHYLPKGKESACAKPHHMISPGSSRYSSNDMVHNHYLKEAKKKTQESIRNSEPSVMPSSRSQAHLMKCVFNANHDSCVTKFMKEVKLHAKVPSNKTTNRNKPVEQTSVARKSERQIPKGHRYSIKKTSIMHEKMMIPRSCLRWKPTGKIFESVGLRWVPTGKIFTSSTTKVDSEPKNGSNEDITNQYECEQTLDVSAGTITLNAAMTSDHNSSKLKIHDHNNEPSSSKLVLKVVPPADTTAASRQELELLFHHHMTMLRLKNTKKRTKSDQNRTKMGSVVKENKEKDKNRIKTGQKREAWQSREKFKADAVERGRKTEENKKRMAENAYTYQKLFKIKENKKRKGRSCKY